MARLILPISTSSLLLSNSSPSLARACSTAPARSLNFSTAHTRVSSSTSSQSLPLERRSVVIAGVSILWASIGTGVLVAATAMSTSMVAGKYKGQQASLSVKRGMELFVQGDVAGSLAKFDDALELDPRQKPYLWQRGLSLYYLNRFEEGADQFREDVAVNPNDTEESIWCFLCEAQTKGVEEARKQFLEVGQDRRPLMQRAYEVFTKGGNPGDLIHEFKDGQPYEVFYAHLYAGLYHESEGDSEAAKSAMVAACRTPYGIRSGDYMASLAKLLLQFTAENDCA
ncbi:hypothetical protein GOP47_0014622 [Adiantum capillus-veneris]|uniref:Uncharacterized protein n=1 Tax=Adiantum capillus-veneris TaxID=13818 RepID=A0A9D4ULU9_ADICA|nr:hypothetical protein GOP47_0014622 [Adiantum capillus-veneris]